MCTEVNQVATWLSENCTAQANNQTFFNELFQNFYPTGELWIPGINNPTDDQLNFQNLLKDLCNQPANGGFCSNNWTQICSNYTRSDAANPIVQQFCGCYLPESQYNQSIQRSCDPICSNINNVQYFPGPTALSPQPCNSNVCIIDNVTIDIISSNVGPITFSQLCTNCGVAGSCQCIIGDIDIISQNSQLAGINLTQNCGGNVTCFNSSQEQVDCSQYLGTFGTNSQVVQNQKTKDLIFIFGFALLALLFFILFIIGFKSWLGVDSTVESNLSQG